MPVEQLPRLSRQTLDVLALLLAEDRPMYVGEVQDRLHLAKGASSRYLASLALWGLVAPEPEPEPRRAGAGRREGRRVYYGLTLAGRRDGPVILQRAGRDPVGSVLWRMLVRCDEAAVTIADHIDRATVAGALRDVGTVLTVTGGNFRDVDPALADRLVALGRACTTAADRCSPLRVFSADDRDQAWRALRHVRLVLRELVAGSRGA